MFENACKLADEFGFTGLKKVFAVAWYYIVAGHMTVLCQYHLLKGDYDEWIRTR